MRNDELSMNKLFKKLLKTVLPLLLGSCILIWVYRDFDFSRVGHTMLHEMNWWWMVVSLLFGIASHIFRGWRWLLALAPLDAYPKKSNCVNAVFLSYAANLVLPRLGEVSRCGVLSKYDGVTFSKSLGTVVTERIIDAVCMTIITAIALLLQMKVFSRFFQQTGTDLSSIASLFSSVQFYIVLFCILGILVLLYFLLRTLSFFEKVKGVVLNIWEGVISLKDTPNISLYILYTLLIWFCYFMQFYLAFFCFSFTADLGTMAGLVLFVAGTLAVIVPTPNGAGPWHFAVISMLMLYGVDIADAGIFALLVHGIQTLLVILLGLYAFVALPIKNKN